MKDLLIRSAFSLCIFAFIASSNIFAADKIVSDWPSPSVELKKLNISEADCDFNKDGQITPAEAIYAIDRYKFKKQYPDYREPEYQNPNCLNQTPEQNFKNTILVSVDGLDRAVLIELLKADKLPNFRALARTHTDEDFIVKTYLPDHLTQTKAAHAAMLTGLIPEHSRVLSNEMFLPVPKSCTIFERLEDGLGKDNIQTVFVSSKKDNVGARSAESFGGKTVHDVALAGGPYLNAKEAIDYFSDTDKNPKDALKMALSFLSKVKDDKFFAFIHFRSPDSEGHAKGRESPEYREGAQEVDKNLGLLFDFLKENKIWDNTRIIITADHGFVPNEKHHHYAPWTFIITNDKAILTNDSVHSYDTPATILALHGLDLSKMTPVLRGKDIRKAYTITDAQKSDNNKK